MKERPIIFSAPMVRAILAGQKTQTRRIIKLKPYLTIQERDDGSLWPWMYDDDKCSDYWLPCPHGQPGDHLWVRETFAKIDGQTQPWIETDYRATYTHGDRLGDTLGIKKRWTSAIFMPRHASRITLEITGIRVERLQDISEVDGESEGVDFLRHISDADETLTAKQLYQCLWESINGPGSWDANPWVWVVEFKRVGSNNE